MLREQGRDEAGLGGATGVHRLGHRPEGLAHARSLGARRAHRAHDAVDIEAGDLRAGDRGAEDAHGAGDVPAGVVVPGVDSVAGAAADLDAQRDGGDEVAAAGACVFADGEGARERRRGGVDDGGEVGVVVVLEVAQVAVGERRELQRGLAAGAPDRGARVAAFRVEHREHRLQRRVASGVYGDAEHVDDVALRLVHNFARQVGEACFDGELGQVAGGSHGQPPQIGVRDSMVKRGYGNRAELGIEAEESVPDGLDFKGYGVVTWM